MKKKVFLILLCVPILFLCFGCSGLETNETQTPFVKFSPNGLNLSYGFVPTESGSEIVTTATNASQYEVSTLCVTYGFNNTSDTVEERAILVNAGETVELSRASQSYTNSLDDKILHTKKVEYVAKKGKKIQYITYFPETGEYEIVNSSNN